MVGLEWYPCSRLIHHQELVTILLNYLIGRIVLGSMCVGVSVWLVLEWYPCCRLIHHREFATILLNYHIGRIFLGSMCVGVSVWLGWSGIRVATTATQSWSFILQLYLSWAEMLFLRTRLYHYR